ncbi:MAG: DUF1579 domain-containing protein [Fimbriimonadaceae bacterium]|nr:DUF1579 family protein [Chthonomonadaceae bacterium]MCO5296894.1 DUF1579 domain-containing protein [Fimbriimonadaceae bacterium]
MSKLLWIPLLAAALLAGAQDPPALNERPAEMLKLDKLVGSWSGDGHWFAPGGEDRSWKGESKGAWSLRGRYLELKTTVTSANGTSENSAMISWDRARQRYHAVLFFSNDSTPRMVAGEMEGNKLVLSGPAADEGSHLILTFTMESETKYTLLVQLAREEGDPIRVAEGSYTKKKEGS